MEVPVALNVVPINAPHKELDYLPLADMDFQIKDFVSVRILFEYFAAAETII